MGFYEIAEDQPAVENLQRFTPPKASGITYLPSFWVKVALAGGAQNAFAIAQQNPFGEDVVINRAIVDLTTLSATASAVLDVDVVTSATGTGDDIFDGIPIGSGDTAPKIFDSLNATDNGTNGEGKSWQWDKAGGTNDYVTAKILAAAGAALAGDLYLECIPAE